ncbi:MAG: carotenoid biosynthesis protein [Proteobacteria bacterium]|nr:carotenoid biosynthesis protein [Pseudomonadota bacterium]
MPLLIAVNLISIFGFATFSLHPSLLARFEWAPPIFAVSYPLFAQLQILIGFLVFAREAVKRSGGRFSRLLAASVLVSFVMEYCGTTWGIPFGKYSYTSLLGWKILGQVPVLIPLSWFFMSVPSFLLADQLLGERSGRAGRILLGSFLLLSWDLTLEWESKSGPPFHIPPLNLAGWMITGCIILSLYELSGLRSGPSWSRDRFPLRFYLANLLLPFGISLFGGIWAPIATTLLVASACWILGSSTGGIESFRRGIGGESGADASLETSSKPA